MREVVITVPSVYDKDKVTADFHDGAQKSNELLVNILSRGGAIKMVTPFAHNNVEYITYVIVTEAYTQQVRNGAGSNKQMEQAVIPSNSDVRKDGDSGKKGQKSVHNK